ncbi:hypothetical protein DFH06DRAFT_1124755 [Mycena polygramma]|nr:hypothetical protein DFH06DRAFT_1124755 [Mycena polygramma]
MSVLRERIRESPSHAVVEVVKQKHELCRRISASYITPAKRMPKAVQQGFQHVSSSRPHLANPAKRRSAVGNKDGAVVLCRKDARAAGIQLDYPPVFLRQRTSQPSHLDACKTGLLRFSMEGRTCRKWTANIALVQDLIYRSDLFLLDERSSRLPFVFGCMNDLFAPKSYRGKTNAKSIGHLGQENTQIGERQTAPVEGGIGSRSGHKFLKKRKRASHSCEDSPTKAAICHRALPEEVRQKLRFNFSSSWHEGHIGHIVHKNLLGPSVIWSRVCTPSSASVSPDLNEQDAINRPFADNGTQIAGDRSSAVCFAAGSTVASAVTDQPGCIYSFFLETSRMVLCHNPSGYSIPRKSAKVDPT